jgi:hypothetical protein
VDVQSLLFVSHHVIASGTMAKKPTNARKRFASPRAEFLSAAFMSFWMNTIGVELALVRPFLENTLGFTNVDAQGLFLALLFTHLCFFFGPFYGKKSRGALNNPAVYFLFYLTGDADADTASKGALSAVFGTIVGTFAYEKTSRVVVPLIITTGFSKGIVPAVAAGGSVLGAASEATVAFLNFLFAGVAPRLVGDSMAPYAGAFFYVVTVVIEKCRYSCGFMNPAVVLATHVVGGDAFSTDAAKHVLTYATGAGLGAVAAAAAKAVADGKVPGSKPAKHATSGKTKTKKKATATPARVSARTRKPKAA